MTAGWQLRIIFVLLIVGLGVKAALVPLHGWLPAAMVAPAPVSALLHAVAVVKAGAFGMVRVIYDVYGFAPAKQLGVLEPLAWMAAATVIYGSLRALHQDELKKRLAYSTVSQVSYIALGCAVGGPLATLGGIVHLVHQGLMKITLFFCAGNIAENLGRHRVSELKGVGRRLPLTMAAFTLGALGMIGVPPLAGFITKWYLAVGCLSTGQWGVILVLAASSALNAAYFLPILYTAWFQEPDAAWPEEARPGWREVPWMLLVPPLVTAGLAVAAGILASALPLHVWLPLAHPAAPTPSSAVLSGAMIKAGLLGWLRFLPLGGAFLSEWGLLFVGAGLLAALGGVMVGLTQRNLKTVLAYSSISQMGLMTAGVGLALLLPERVPEAVAAVAVTACHHGLTKGALFLGVGMIDAVPRSSRRRVWLHAGLSWCALALAGFPLTGGFLAKGLIKDVAVLLPPPWSDLVNLFLPLTAGGTALLMLHFLSLAIRSPGSGGGGRRSLAFVACDPWMRGRGGVDAAGKRRRQSLRPGCGSLVGRFLAGSPRPLDDAGIPGPSTRHGQITQRCRSTRGYPGNNGAPPAAPAKNSVSCRGGHCSAGPGTCAVPPGVLERLLWRFHPPCWQMATRGIGRRPDAICRGWNPGGRGPGDPVVVLVAAAHVDRKAHMTGEVKAIPQVRLPVVAWSRATPIPTDRRKLLVDMRIGLAGRLVGLIGLAVLQRGDDPVRLILDAGDGVGDHFHGMERLSDLRLVLKSYTRMVEEAQDGRQRGPVFSGKLGIGDLGPNRFELFGKMFHLADQFLIEHDPESLFEMPHQFEDFLLPTIPAGA